MNLTELQQIQKIASQALSLIKKYQPEPEEEEDWESEDDSDIEDDESYDE